MGRVHHDHVPPVCVGVVVRMDVVIRRATLSDTLRAVRELERKGWECSCPIRKIPKWCKKWEWNEKNEFRNFGGVDEHITYFVKMRKVTRNER